MKETYVVTGGAGFIGAAVIRRLLGECNARVVNVDKLTYSSNVAALELFARDANYCFERQDICDGAAIRAVFEQYKPQYVMHLAAESHVDRSIDAPDPFIQTNVVGTYTLLAEAHRYWSSLDAATANGFRFLHVSTDEVYGSLGETGLFTETTRYDPRSPYAASKAASDHLARTWQHTYGLPVIVTNSSNNYGPWQFPEKLIPLTIANAITATPIAVYGRGENVRDWLHVDDHAAALLHVVRRGAIGETYLVSAGHERRNLDVVESICDLVDAYQPGKRPCRELIRFVADRPGHDFRYALDGTKLRNELGWLPTYDFASGLAETVRWYVENRAWWGRIRSAKYGGERIGLGVSS